MINKNKVLAVFLVLLLVLTALSSYYKFGVQMDYIVSYEGPCEPETEICFAECDDDECTEEYYFTLIERKAYEIYDLCGSDVSECEEAFECQPDVEYCTISYCDPEEDEDYCEDINETSI